MIQFYIYRFLDRKPSYRKPKSDAKRHFLKNGTVLSSMRDVEALGIGSVAGRTWDLQGGILSGKKQRGDGGQSENQEPLFTVEMNGLVVRNGFIEHNKDGVRWLGQNGRIESVTWTECGEDCINNKSEKGSGKGMLVRRCEFINPGGDKSIQFNNAEDMLIEECLFFGNITAMRLGESKLKHRQTATSRKNIFFSVETAYNIAGSGCEVRVIDDIYDGVKKAKVIGSKGAKFI